jgi:hypothetical protein
MAAQVLAWLGINLLGEQLGRFWEALQDRGRKVDAGTRDHRGRNR